MQTLLLQTLDLNGEEEIVTASNVCERTHSCSRTFVVAPSTTILPKLGNHRYLLLASFNPHVNFDDIALIVESIREGRFSKAMMSLNLYLIINEE